MLQADRYGDAEKKNIAHDIVLAWFNGKLEDKEKVIDK